ncbi:MAG TPA: DUF892 family protein [Gammaproteobacteria bacterium]
MRTLIADRGMGEPISLGAALVAGKKVPPDATQLLMEDHRVVLGWFEWYEEAEDESTKGRIAKSICMALRAHMAAEEEILYPGAQMQTQQAELVERARQEHEGARRIMAQIERGDGGADRDDLVRRLEAEIRTHVDEEETELFPAVRGSPMDLYAVGRAVAARRVDSLFEQNAKTPAERELKEYPNMQISQDEARDFFILGLKNCHATASQGRSMVEAAAKRMENYPSLRQKLQSHLGEKNAQIERLERLLHSVGESPSALKDAAMKAAASAMTLASTASDDEVIKNGFALLAQSKYEAAAYETLLLFAEAAGETAALKPLQKCLSEERGMAAFVEENLRATGMRFLQLRSQGAQASH